MSFSTGAGARCALGNEVAWGTPVADSVLFNMLSESLQADPEKKEEESLLASKASAGYDLMGIKVAGDLSGILKPEHAGLILKWAFGGVDTVTADFGGVTGQYQHSIVLAGADDTLPSKTIIIDRKQAIKRYAGMKVNSLKLSAKAGDFVRLTVSLKGKDVSAGTIVTTAVPSKKGYKFLNGTLTLGALALAITGWDFDLQNNLEDGPQTSESGVYYSEPQQSTRKIQLMIDMPYDAEAETIAETYAMSQTLFATGVLHLESPEIITGSSKHRIDLNLNNVAIIKAPVNVGGRGMLTIQITAEATAVGTTEPVTALVYDGVATAY